MLRRPGPIHRNDRPEDERSQQRYRHRGHYERTASARFVGDLGRLRHSQCVDVGRAQHPRDTRHVLAAHLPSLIDELESPRVEVREQAFEPGAELSLRDGLRAPRLDGVDRRRELLRRAPAIGGSPRQALANDVVELSRHPGALR
jgi:hypothetical protein